MKRWLRLMAVCGTTPYYCRFCGAGPFYSEVEGAAHSRAAHGEQ